MATKVSVYSKPATRISINETRKTTVRTIGVTGAEGSSISQLHDVDMSGASNNETLVYDATSGKFVVRELPNIDGGTF